jgi:hypothetical protein
MKSRKYLLIRPRISSLAEARGLIVFGKIADSNSGDRFNRDTTVTARASDAATGRTVLNSDFRKFDGFGPSGNDTVQLTKGDAAHPTIAKIVLARNQDKVPYRTELSANSKDQQLLFDHDYSTKFTNRLVDWKTDKSADAIFQLHAIPADELSLPRWRFAPSYPGCKHWTI